jgi:nitroimidazol reductase NimA-like FMN-containing flavoprotein (pyridoxamine 5'-phosphate oxidase superfamily)
VYVWYWIRNGYAKSIHANRQQYLLIAGNGNKSGCESTLPVNYVWDGDILYITSTRGHTWWRNLRGGMSVRVWLQGRDLTAEGMVA